MDDINRAYFSNLTIGEREYRMDEEADLALLVGECYNELRRLIEP